MPVTRKVNLKPLNNEGLTAVQALDFAQLILDIYKLKKAS